jgi:formylglycine-generating enzyme required for sulfatase activity
VYPWYARVSYRGRFAPEDRYGGFGFRCAAAEMP